MTITPHYLDQNRQLHKASATYGVGGWKWIGIIQTALTSLGARSVIDYGAGKGTLGHWWRSGAASEIPLTNFDPATFPERPQIADMVVSTDVLEHIEPEHVNAVLDDIATLGRRGAFLVISCRPAKKELPDGRNAHLSVCPPAWWAGQLERRYKLVHPWHETRPEIAGPDEAVFLCRHEAK